MIRIVAVACLIAASVSACATKVEVRREAPRRPIRIEWSQRITERAPCEGIRIGAAYAGRGLWRLRAINDGEVLVRVLWDESAYITAEGDSSRLIRADSRRLDVVKTQPASPVPPGARLEKSFTAETFADVAGVELADRLQHTAGEGARLYLSVDVGGERRVWEADVTWIAREIYEE